MLSLPQVALPDDEAAAPIPFHRHLREATIVEHRRTERAPFIRGILTGTAPIDDFAAMTGQWYALYGALETAVHGAAAHDPIVAAFADTALDRRAALEADLGTMLGGSWREATMPLPSTAAYVERIGELDDGRSSNLVAHHYLRYLGDLSGGQIIARIAARTYGLTPDAGLTFYRFDAIADPAAYKDAYRARLDVAPFGEEGRRSMVDEVDRGYRMTAAIFSELEALA